MFFDYKKYESAWTLDIQCASEVVEIVAASGKTPRIAVVYKGAEPVIQVYQNVISFLEAPADLQAPYPANQPLPANYQPTPAERLETDILQGMNRPKRHLRIGISGPVNLRVRDVSVDAGVSLEQVRIHQSFHVYEGRRIYAQSEREIQLFDARELEFDIAGSSKLNLLYATDCRVQGTLHDKAQAFFAGNFLRGFDVADEDPGTQYQIRGKFPINTEQGLFSSKSGFVAK